MQVMTRASAFGSHMPWKRDEQSPGGGQWVSGQWVSIGRPPGECL